MTFSKMSTTVTDMCGSGNGWIIQRFKKSFSIKKMIRKSCKNKRILIPHQHWVLQYGIFTEY